MGVPCNSLTTLTECRPLKMSFLSWAQENDSKCSAGKVKPLNETWVNLNTVGRLVRDRLWLEMLN